MATMNQIGVSLSGQTGTGQFVGWTSPTLTSAILGIPALGTVASGNLINCGTYQWGTNAGSPIQMQFSSGTLIPSQIQTLNALPQPVIDAPGANLVCIVANYAVYYVYGTTPYTAAASQTIQLGYGTSGSPVLVSGLISNATLIGTDSVVTAMAPSQVASVVDTSVVNTGVYLFNPVATELTTGDSELNYFIWYFVIDVTSV